MSTVVPVAFGLTPTFWVACAAAAAVGFAIGALALAVSVEARESRAAVLIGSALAGPIFILALAGLVALQLAPGVQCVSGLVMRD
jgi:hypothetical protein